MSRHDCNETPDEAEFQWVELDESTSQTYWKMGFILAMVAAAAVLGASTTTVGASAETSFTADNVETLTTHNGMIQEVTVAPAGEIDYYGLESEPDEATVEVQVRSDGTDGWETVDSTTVGSEDTLGYAGTVEYGFDTIDLFDSSSLNRADLRAPNGETVETEIDIRVSVTFEESGTDGADVTDSSQDTFTVTVENIQSGADVGGNANTDGDA